MIKHAVEVVNFFGNGLPVYESDEKTYSYVGVLQRSFVRTSIVFVFEVSCNKTSKNNLREMHK